MKLVLLALFCYLVSNGEGAPQHRPRHRRGLQKIVGGADAVVGQVPYQVSIQDISFGYGFHVCGGTVYDETNVITTGMCVDGLDFSNPNTLQVAAGKLDLSLTESNEQVALLQKIVRHRDFDTFTLINDIALLHLTSSLVFDQFVGAAPMPSEDQISVGDCQVSGWGLTVEGGSSSNVLQVTTVPVVTDDDCRAVYGDTDVKKVLGIVFDSPKLTFTERVKYLKGVITRKINIMKALSSKSFGCSRNTLRRIYVAFVRSRVEYGCQILEGISDKNLQILEVTQNVCLRLILGARQTSPILSMQIDAYIPPLSLRFKYLNLKCLIKLRQRGTNDFTVDCLSIKRRVHPPSSFIMVTNGDCALMSLTLPPSVTVEAFSPFHPWVDLVSLVELDLPIDFSASRGVNTMFQDYINTMYPNHVCIYTDGSKLQNGSASAAFYISEINKAVNWLLPAARSVIGSELFAIWKALQYANTNIFFKSKRVLVLCDSQSALQLISDKYKPSYKNLVFSIHKELVQTQTHGIKFQWVKSHAKIKHNEAVDRLAKMAHDGDRSALVQLEVEEVIQLLSVRFLEYWTRFWKASVQASQAGSFLSSFLDEPSFRSHLSFTPRSAESALCRFRLGHVGVNSHKFRFEMSESSLCTECNVPETISHYWLQCKKYSVPRTIMAEGFSNLGVTFNLQNIFSTGPFPISKQRKIVRIAADYIIATNKSHEL